MNKLILALLCILALNACSRKEEAIGFSGRSPEEKVLYKEMKPGAMLAYEHSIEIETGAGQIPQLFESAQQTCLAHAGEGCVVLESHISTGGEQATSTLKFRAKHAAIEKIVDSLSKQGTLVHRSTVAEDLGVPIEDGAKKLQMLKDYRSKLEALQARANLDVDALIKLTRELADVQVQIEASTGTQAKLVQRVDTEILQVQLRSVGSSAPFHPVSRAASKFSENLAEGVASAITAIAFLLPWSLLLAVLGWALRKLWRFWRKSPK